MKSMTDFIMEQEVSTAPVEVFNESALVSNFMSMHAAAAEVACVLEFVSIAEFCTENDINMPEQLVQEGFKDTINKIWTAIAKWFEKVAAWFKSLVKGTINTFSTANIKQVIAKLKTYPGDTKIKNTKIIGNIMVVYFVIGALETFREVAIHKLTDNAEVSNTDKLVVEFNNDIDDYIADLKFINKRSNWQDAESNIITKKLYSELKSDKIKEYLVACCGSDASAMDATLADDNYTYEDLINDLEHIISLNIPKTGAKILEELDTDLNAFKQIATQNKTISVDVDQGDDINAVRTKIENADAIKDKMFDKISNDDIIKAAKASQTGGFDSSTGKLIVSGTINIEVSMKIWQSNKDIKDKITTASNLLATTYDSVKNILSEIVQKEFKDIKASDEKEYQKALKSVEKTENSRSLSKNNNLVV